MGNLLVTSTTPVNPEPIKWDPDTMTSVPLSAVMSAAYNASDNVTLTIYDTEQNVKKTFTAQQLIGASATTVTNTWDGSLDTGTDKAPKGIYLFKWVASNNSIGDCDTDKSATLTIDAPVAKAELVGSDGTNGTFNVTYTLSDSSNKPVFGGHIDAYKSDLTLLATVDLGAADLTLGQHSKQITVPMPDDGNDYCLLVSVQDDHATDYRGHNKRWAVQHNNTSTIKYVSGTGCSYSFTNPDGFTGTLQTITITLNGTQLWNGASIGGGGATSPKGVSYDSTHFPDKTLLTFTTVATNTSGQSWTKTDTYVVYNKYGIQYGADLGPAVLADDNIAIDTDLVDMNHTRVLSGSTPSPKDWAFNLNNAKKICKEATAINITSHGSPEDFATTAGMVNRINLTYNDIAAAVKIRGNRPPINVVFANACSTMNIYGILGFPYLPVAFGITSPTSNRAYIGFDAVVWLKPEIADVFWKELAQFGKTVEQARKTAQVHYDDINEEYNSRFPANLVIVGDCNTRLKEKKTSWYVLN